MTELQTTLRRLGDALESAADTDLRTAARMPARRRRVSTRVALIAAAVAVLVPSVAFAASLHRDGRVAQASGQDASLAGAEPACTVVVQDVEYRTCSPGHAHQVSDWKGTVEPTVDATKHVNGGCRSLASDGREWECYIGQAAVDQLIIGAGFLGEYAPTPGQG
jgi:hypothetical protein